MTVMTKTERQALLEECVRVATLAGGEILAVHAGGALGVRSKSDASPLTEADLRSNEVLLEGLGRAARFPIVSEESLDLLKPGHDWSKEPAYWLVDPLDGTRDFVAGKDSFVVSVALIESGTPTIGVIHAPALRKTYWASLGAGAFRDGDRIRNDRSGKSPELVAFASGSQASERSDAFMRAQGIREVQRMGSAIKFCLVAEGLGDLYPRFGRTYEWDVAAGHAILNEAGCRLLALDSGATLTYGKPQFLNEGFMAARDGLDVAGLAAAAQALRRGHGGT